MTTGAVRLSSTHVTFSPTDFRASGRGRGRGREGNIETQTGDRTRNTGSSGQCSNRWLESHHRSYPVGALFVNFKGCPTKLHCHGGLAQPKLFLQVQQSLPGGPPYYTCGVPRSERPATPLQLLDSAARLHIAEVLLLFHVPLSLPCVFFFFPIMSVQEWGAH